ncbi:MAG TPA: MoaD/ThiS family protein [Novosphingobium sp.]|nr:MoaD/ThiS family protein [Novosphingobium sp.]HNN57010.1 MoaD/ThiS family protein [Novosphingobium sp.]
MKARLVFLGKLADLAGAGEIEVTPGPLEAVLTTLSPSLAVELLGERVRMALNGEITTDRAVVLGAGDELAFLPSVSGG